MNTETLDQVALNARIHYAEHRRLEAEEINNGDELDEFLHWMVRVDANTIRFKELPEDTLLDSYSEYPLVDQYDDYLEVLKNVAGRTAVDTVNLMIRRNRAILDAKRHFSGNNEAYVKIALSEAALAGVDINYPEPV